MTPTTPSREKRSHASRRALVAGLDAMLAEVVAQALHDAAGVVNVEVAARGGDVRVPDGLAILVVAEDDPRARSLPGVLLERPELSVIVVREGGVRASMIELWPRTDELGDVSPASLSAAASSASDWKERFAGA